MRSQEDDIAEAIIEALLRSLWGFRLEITLALVGAAMWTAIWHSHGAIEAGIGLGLAMAVVLVLPLTRRVLARLLRHSRVRRQWGRAVRAARIPSLDVRAPTVRKLRDIPAGERFDVRIPPGSSATELERASEVIAAALRVRDLRVRRNPDNASLAEVVIARRDPLAVGAPQSWPHADLPRASIWEPIPVGVGEDGEDVTVLLPGAESSSWWRARSRQVGCTLDAGRDRGPRSDMSTLAIGREARRARHLEPLRRRKRRCQLQRRHRGAPQFAGGDGSPVFGASGFETAKGGPGGCPRPLCRRH